MNRRKSHSAKRLAFQLVGLLVFVLLMGALIGSEGLVWSKIQADASLIADIRMPRTLFGGCFIGVGRRIGSRLI